VLGAGSAGAVKPTPTFNVRCVTGGNTTATWDNKRVSVVRFSFAEGFVFFPNVYVDGGLKRNFGSLTHSTPANVTQFFVDFFRNKKPVGSAQGFCF
jgi:hypothetical protein